MRSMRRLRRSATKRRTLLPTLFLLPCVLLLVFVGLLPLFPVARLAFHRYIVAAQVHPIFVGLGNFREILFSSDFAYYLGITLLLMVVVLGIQLPLGLGIALLLVKKFKGRELFQTLFSLPLAIAPIAVGCIWQLVLRPEIGPIPMILNRIGINFNYMESFQNAFAAIVLINTWQWTPLVALMILPSLVSIPPDVLEAARMDGAGFWQVLKHIILPMVKPVIMLVIFIRMMDTFKIFDEVWILTGGGPGWSTRFISIDIVRRIIFETDYGMGSALSLFVLYLVIVMCWIAVVIMKGGKLEES